MGDAKIGSKDPQFTSPFIDIDEWRDEPVRHRYVHGGFEGTDTLFSMYFPPEELYEGRFFQPLMPISGTENAAPFVLGGMMGGSIDFAVGTGAYLVESNLGRKVMFPGEDPTLVGYRASAAVARHSREVAAEMYGEHRPYGYVYGGSGGAYKTIGCIENTVDVWDGAVPFVHGSPMSLPNLFTVQAHAFRVLGDVFPRIVDAVEPGGSGDMYEGLSNEQREALAEVTRMGFPPRAWFDHERVAAGYTGVFASLVTKMLAWDPEYFEDFWSVPGYLGANPPESLLAARVQHKTTIAKVVRASEAAELGLPMAMSAMFGDSEHDMPAALRLESLPEGNIQGATLTLTSGEATGHRLLIAMAIDDLVMTGFGEENFEALRSISDGDEVELDNAIYLAGQTYHRHQVPEGPDYPAWDQFRVGGEPLYPQRPIIGPGYARGGGGSIQSGRFTGKMIAVISLMDETCVPWQGDWYRSRVAEHLGDRLDDHYRIWFIDHAMHTTPMVGPDDPRPVRTTRAISYAPVLQQALRDLSAWVENGLAPPASTEYEIDDGQVLVPDTAAARKGIQPVAHVQVDGGVRSDVAVGQEVTFTAQVEVPPGTGTIIAAEWDFDGSGEFAEQSEGIDGANPTMLLSTTHAFPEAGTYFPALRVTSQRQGNVDAPFARIQNLGRVRVVVT
jgi:hypothetical protein